MEKEKKVCPECGVDTNIVEEVIINGEKQLELSTSLQKTHQKTIAVLKFACRKCASLLRENAPIGDVLNILDSMGGVKNTNEIFAMLEVEEAVSKSVENIKEKGTND